MEGVKAKMAQGYKAEEVGFQLAFSKTELRKVIKEYPGKEVNWSSFAHIFPILIITIFLTLSFFQVLEFYDFML